MGSPAALVRRLERLRTPLHRGSGGGLLAYARARHVDRCRPDGDQNTSPPALRVGRRVEGIRRRDPCQAGLARIERLRYVYEYHPARKHSIHQTKAD